MFTHYLIKLNFIDIGFLPNYPYRLISDSEMFEAFTKTGGFFETYYPCPSGELSEEYTTLKNYIFERIEKFQNEEIEVLPDWIYSYMLMRPITFDSPEPDIAYLYDLLNLDSATVLTEFNEEAAKRCYQVSEEWLKKLPSRYGDRPPTMFGETHVTKSRRLAQANILVEPGGI